jgi:hypothetical protein
LSFRAKQSEVEKSHGVAVGIANRALINNLTNPATLNVTRGLAACQPWVWLCGIDGGILPKLLTSFSYVSFLVTYSFE